VAEPAVASTPHFALHSDLGANLNDALIVAGRSRRAKGQELFQAGPDKACFDALPAEQRAGWTRAVDYHAEIVSPVQYTARPQVLPRLVLAGVANVEELTGDERHLVQITAAFQAAARPAYERCRWPAQDAANRRWIDHVVGLLRAHETALGERLPELSGAPWVGLPLRVDVVETVDATGANTVNVDPPGAHIVVSSGSPSNQERAALEILFHEASHSLTRRGTPVGEALAAAVRDLGSPKAGDLTHGVLFYMTGEAVRRVVGRAGEPAYQPYLYAQRLFSDRFRETVGRVWPPYMDGTRTLAEVSRDLVRALSAPVEQP
jgi:hypothetical protein